MANTTETLTVNQNIEEENARDIADEDSTYLMMDPDHPLMKRFQAALGTQLEKQHESIKLELREMIEALRNGKREREDLADQLYSTQQELARQQMLLEAEQDECNRLSEERSRFEHKVKELQNNRNQLLTSAKQNRKRAAELKLELDGLTNKLAQLDRGKDDVHSDIIVMKRAANKANQELSKAASEKQKQDLLVNKLTEKIEQLDEAIKLYEAQYKTQSDETKTTRQNLTEAYTEIEAINFEKKQLFYQWNTAVLGMKRRNEAYFALQEALSQQKQHSRNLEIEIEGYKKSIVKAEEENERLVYHINKTDTDIAQLKKSIISTQSKHEALQVEFTTFSRILQETEQALVHASADKAAQQTTLTILQTQLQKNNIEKARLEDEIVLRLQSKLSAKNAALFSGKVANRMRERRSDLESNVAKEENEITTNMVEMANVNNRIKNYQKELREINKEIEELNKVVTRGEREVTRRTGMIERKQVLIDQQYSKLDQFLSQTGGVELGPLEIQINSLNKSIDAAERETEDMQKQWLRDQTELVKYIKEQNQQSQEITELTKRLNILAQKKLRIEGEIEEQENEVKDYNRNMRSLQNDMVKLNNLLHKEKGLQTTLEEENVLVANDFVKALKEQELAAIQDKNQLEAINEEKKQIYNSLIEAQRQIMLWEKKIQMAREAKATVSSEDGGGEIKAMKKEIHRMEVHYSSLLREQEKLIQAMEKSVSVRDTIATRGEALAKNKFTVTKATFEQQLSEMRRKIKEQQKESERSEQEMKELAKNQQEIGEQLDNVHTSVQQMQTELTRTEDKIDQMSFTKQRNLTAIVSKQQKSKYYQQINEGKYKLLCKDEAVVATEFQRQEKRLEALDDILSNLSQEYSHVAPHLDKVRAQLI